jgi:hypothetical protein
VALVAGIAVPAGTAVDHVRAQHCCIAVSLQRAPPGTLLRVCIEALAPVMLLTLQQEVHGNPQRQVLLLLVVVDTN